MNAEKSDDSLPASTPEAAGSATDAYGAWESTGIVESSIVRLEKTILELRAQSGSARALRAQAEDDCRRVTCLFATLAHLTSAVTRNDAIAVVQEVLANLVGTECYAAFLHKGEGGGLEPLFSLGVGPEWMSQIAAEAGAVGKALRTGSVVLVRAPAEARESQAAAAIPLRMRNQTVGVIAVARLLPQKNGWDSLDIAVLELLAEYAAVSILSKAEGIA